MNAPPSGPRALIVEDDPSWQQILNEILSDAGLVVDVAEGLVQAQALLSASPHRLAVVDLSLSASDHNNQDGLRVLDAVQRHDPSCVTIMLTGFATVEIAVSVLTDHGAFTCLRKEAFHRGQFRQLIQRALASPPAHNVAGSNDAPGKVSAPGTSGAPASPEMALVAEDDAGWRGILSELLADAGYSVRLCSGFGEALGCLRREKYALAVIDLSLAGAPGAELVAQGRAPVEQNLDGYRLLASIRAGGIPAIVVSGVATPRDIERAYAEHGIFAYLEKQTFNRRAFLQTVKEAGQANLPDELSCLTGREREVFDLLAQGMTNKEIAEVLVITINTVKRHLKAIFEKLNIHTRAAAAARVRK